MNDNTLTQLILELDNHIHFTEANRFRRKVKGGKLAFVTWTKMLRKLLRYAGTKRALRAVKASYED